MLPINAASLEIPFNRTTADGLVVRTVPRQTGVGIQPTIYAITPTHHTPTQEADLTRQINTFLHVKRFHWIVIEDSDVRTTLVSDLLWQSRIEYTHLNALSPKINPKKHRGVLQRNAGLDWIRTNLHTNNSGVVYFADDDNTYSLQLFEEVNPNLSVFSLIYLFHFINLHQQSLQQ